MTSLPSVAKPAPESRKRPLRLARRMSRMGASAVREILKVTERPDIISFAGGLPAPELFPVKAIAEAHETVFSSQGSAALQYSTTEGWKPLREWIGRRMQSRGINADSDNVLITSGSQQGIDLVARIFLEAGDVVVVENPCYLAALQAFSAYEATMIGVGSDEAGMRVDQVERVLMESAPKLIYVVSDFSNPKGTSLSLDRRARLVELSRRYNVPILEDDPYSELRYRGQPSPSLASLDEDGLVIYLSTFSKTLSPGMRIGWVAASSELIYALVIAKQATDLHTSTIEQRAASTLLETFDYDGHISELNRVYGSRCFSMLEALESHFPKGMRWTQPEGGLFLWVELPEGVRADALLEVALRRKVAFVPGAPFFVNAPRRDFIRLNFSNQSTEMIEEGIERLGRAIREQVS
ncbi:MAG TPA: PLP-dependent aminotransferase family protein [Blastocatellia bacterium]|nr:PLP-dependent aminotransferase family protein [Blastocatellia bacterium]